MSSLKYKTRSMRVRFMAAFVATLGLVLGVVPTAVAADFTVQLDLRVNCTGYDGGPELRLYYEGSDEVTRFKVEGTAIIDGSDPIVAGNDLNSGVIAVAGGLDRYFFGLWGDEWWPATTTSTTGTIFWKVFYDTGTLDDPVWTPLPSADGSESYDCTPAPPPDADGDGVPDSLDTCPGTAAGATDIDASGCSWEQRDDDKDGVPNGSDNCENTPIGETANSSGCSSSQVDSDRDGVYDSVDQCPTQAGSAENGGCPVVNPDVTYLVSGKLGKICQTAKGCKTTVVVNHLAGQAAPILTAELSSGKLLSVKPRRENVNTSVYVISFPKGVWIVSVSAALPPGAQLH